ncbi:hypothetical protein [Actinomadura algeriensis]|uniref:Uncharacterized protein n=1 Tax=Actinomadura algeriensis TaxID=1679523 RepID=A0ABR9K139_9ACTN|nr:hypothetical protein [Actinomadura algeriensis]MBE1536559.1 hypothetical protein [Actinomadura algeriensis]
MPGFAVDHPVYLDGSVPMDGLFNALMEVASEVWVLRDRLGVVEELLRERGTVTREDIELYRPGPELTDRLAADRRMFLERIMEAVAAAAPPTGERAR